MKSTMPTVHCDSEDGCPEWSIDWYEATASNWRELMEGWTYDPHRKPDEAYCPEHSKAEATR